MWKQPCVALVSVFVEQSKWEIVWTKAEEVIGDGGIFHTEELRDL